MLKVNNCSVYYGKITGVSQISFTLRQGECFAVLGVNGAGKSTLFSALAGLLPCEGEILFQEQNINKLDAPHRAAMGIAFIPEGRRIFASLNVEENLCLGGYCKSLKYIKNEINNMYTMFPILKEKKNQLAGYLSGGQQQLLAFARALMAQPKLLLIDEPTMGLSPVAAKEIYALIKQLKKQGMSIVLSGQDIGPTLALADNGLVLEVGETVAQGSSLHLLQNARLQDIYTGSK